jgi:tetratricopeptide (TPR) repeat protein
MSPSPHKWLVSKRAESLVAGAAGLLRQWAEEEADRPRRCLFVAVNSAEFSVVLESLIRDQTGRNRFTWTTFHPDSPQDVLAALAAAEDSERGHIHSVHLPSRLSLLPGETPPPFFQELERQLTQPGRQAAAPVVVWADMRTHLQLPERLPTLWQSVSWQAVFFDWSCGHSNSLEYPLHYDLAHLMIHRLRNAFIGRLGFARPAVIAEIWELLADELESMGLHDLALSLLETTALPAARRGMGWRARAACITHLAEHHYQRGAYGKARRILLTELLPWLEEHESGREASADSSSIGSQPGIDRTPSPPIIRPFRGGSPFSLAPATEYFSEPARTAESTRRLLTQLERKIAAEQADSPLRRHHSTDPSPRALISAFLELIHDPEAVSVKELERLVSSQPPLRVLEAICNKVLPELLHARWGEESNDNLTLNYALLWSIARSWKSSGACDEAQRLEREVLEPLADRHWQGDAGTALALLVLEERFSPEWTEMLANLFEEELLPVLDCLVTQEDAVLVWANLANALVDEGQAERATRLYLDRVAPSCERLGYYERALETLDCCVGLLKKLQRSEEALELLLERSLPLARAWGSVEHQILIVLRAATLMARLGRLLEAMQLIRANAAPLLHKIQELLRKPSEDDSGRLQNDAGSSTRRRADPRDPPRFDHETALSFFRVPLSFRILATDYRDIPELKLTMLEELFIPLARLLDEWQHLAEALFEAGVIHGLFQRFDRALPLRREAAEIFAEHGELSDQAYALLDFAEAIDNLGRREEAIHIILERVLPLFRQDGNLPGVIEAYRILVRLRRAQERKVETLRILREEILPLAREQGDYEATLNTLNQIVWVLITAGRLQEAHQVLHKQTLPGWRKIGDRLGEALALEHAATLHDIRREADESLRILEKEVLPIYKSAGTEAGCVKVLNRIGTTYQGRKMYSQALDVYRNRLLPRQRRRNDILGCAHTQSRIADVIGCQGDIEGALRLLNDEVLPVFQRLRQEIEIADTYFSIAKLLHRKGLFDQTIQIIRKEVLPVYDQEKHPWFRAEALQELTRTLHERGNHLESAQLAEQELLPLLERLGRWDRYADMSAYMAHAVEQSGDKHRAVQILLDQTLPLYRKFGRTQELAAVTGYTVLLTLEIGKTDEALELCQELVPLQQEIGDLPASANSLELLITIHQERGELAKALRLLRRRLIPLRQRIGDDPGCAQAMERAAHLLSKIGGKRNLKLAAKLTAKAQSIRRRGSYPHPPRRP